MQPATLLRRAQLLTWAETQPGAGAAEVELGVESGPAIELGPGLEPEPEPAQRPGTDDGDEIEDGDCSGPGQV